MRQPDGDVSLQPRGTADKAVGAGLMVIGALAILGSFAIAPDYDGSTTARIFPLITALVISGMGASMLRARPAGAQAGEQPAGSAPWRMLAVSVGYLWLMGKVGYLLSTALAAPLALWVFGVRNQTGLLVAAVVCPLAYHLVFFELLGTYPPYGTWVDPLLDLGR